MGFLYLPQVPTYFTSQGRGDTITDRQVPGTDSSYGVVPLPFPSLLVPLVLRLVFAVVVGTCTGI